MRLLSERELAIDAASPFGGGELVSGSWRWWRGRPRLALADAAPSRLGIWRAELFGEEQTYGASAERFSESRRGGGLTLSQWTSTMTRWEGSVGIDVWNGDARTFSISGGVDQRALADRISLRADGAVFAGSFTAWTAGARIAWRSSTRDEGTVVLSNAGVAVASADAPHALWSGAGTGPARAILLRAHPLLDDGSIAGPVFGRRIVHGSAEARRWLKPLIRVVRLAPAMFVDAAAADHRLAAGRAWQTDVGAGLRVAAPGAGVIRVDVARGLRDGDMALSVGWTR